MKMSLVFSKFRLFEWIFTYFLLKFCVCLFFCINYLFCLQNFCIILSQNFCIILLQNFCIIFYAKFSNYFFHKTFALFFSRNFRIFPRIFCIYYFAKILAFFVSKRNAKMKWNFCKKNFFYAGNPTLNPPQIQGILVHSRYHPYYAVYDMKKFLRSLHSGDMDSYLRIECVPYNSFSNPLTSVPT